MRAPRSTRKPRPRPGTTPRSTAVLRYEQRRGHDVKSYYVGTQQMGEHQAPQGRRGREEGQGLHATHQGDYGRGAGQLDGVTYDEARYEGYGPGGAAIMVDCLTDNRTRTVAEVRHAFTKNGGNLGSDGSVAYLFRQVGQFVFAPGTSEDRVMEAALDAGAEDVLKNDDGSVELICAPAEFAEITMRPNAESSLAGGEAASLRRLLEALENLDDVQDVYTTAVID